jgi:predicted protein tyrosine phosphatase
MHCVLSNGFLKAESLESQMKKILFICSKHELRSPTAENIFKNSENMDVRSAGLDVNANVRVSDEDIEWADYIFVMEKQHEYKLKNRFSGKINNKKIYILNIEDKYQYMDAELIKILKRKVPRFFEVQ